MKSLAIFYVVSLLTACLNYLFQAAAAKLLGQENYAQFMSEWSLVNALMFFGSIASFWAALGNVRAKNILVLSAASFILSGLLLIAYQYQFEGWILSTSLVLASVAQSFMLGKWLGGGRKLAFCVLSLVTAALKLGFIFLWSDSKTSTIFISILLAYFLGTMIVFVFTKEPLKDLNRQKSNYGWIAAVLLAIGTHFLPNADVLWFRYFSTSAQLELFSPVSLVTRAIFFFQIIFAQWWLSESVEKIKINNRVIYLLLLISIFFAVVIAVIIRWCILAFLNWKFIPDVEYFLLAGVYAAATGLFFQFLQLRVVEGNVFRASLMLLLTIIAWLICGYLKISPWHFLLSSASLYLIVVLALHHVGWRQRNIL